MAGAIWKQTKTIRAKKKQELAHKSVVYARLTGHGGLQLNGVSI